MTDQPGRDLWEFYCWLCEQWCETEGPWCQLYRNAGRTSPCYFDENPARRGGVLYSEDPVLVDVRYELERRERNQ
jgi:hypothetical protein